MDNWADIVRRRKENDPLMKGGNHRTVDELKISDVRCAKTKCQSRSVKLEFNYGTCLECGHIWKRRK